MPEFNRPRHVKLSGGPHDGKVVDVSPKADYVQYPVVEDDTGTKCHRYFIKENVGVYEGIVDEKPLPPAA